MRRLRYSVAASLDGYIAGPKGEYDWLTHDPTVDFAALMEEFDTVLMGRKTFEVALSHGADGTTPGMRTIVFSTSLDPAQYPAVEIVAEGAADTVRALKAEEGKDIWLMGGGILFRSLLAAGLVDRVEVSIMPTLLGGGIALLPPPAQLTRLKFQAQETFPSGIIHLSYAVQGF